MGIHNRCSVLLVGVAVSVALVSLDVVPAVDTSTDCAAGPLAGLLSVSVAAPRAWAQTRPVGVAIVNGARDQEAGARLATEIRSKLTLTSDVRPLTVGADSRALESALAPRTSAPADLAAAQEYLARARESLAQFDYLGAGGHLDVAESRLLATWPSLRAFALLADVNFERGLLFMRRNQLEAAIGEFVTVHRLDPSHGALNPARYPPEVVQAFEAAARRVADPGPPTILQVTSEYDGATVYLNGRIVGTAPIAIEVAASSYYVSGTFADRHVVGMRVEIGRDAGRAEYSLVFPNVIESDRSRHHRLMLVMRERADSRKDRPVVAPTELAAVALERSDVEAVIVIADDGAGILYLASYDARNAEQVSWVQADDTSAELIVQGLAMPPERGRGGLEERAEPTTAASDEPPWWRRPATLNTSFGLTLATVAIAVILTRPSQVEASCCTISSALGGFTLPFP